MLTEWIEWLELMYQPPGFGAVSFITTRAFLSATFALLISIFLGQRIIQWLQKMQLGETIRKDVGLDHHLSKRGTPTMGGLIIILATVVPTLLWMRMDTMYTWLIVFVMVFLGGIGFADDYIKVIKKDKSGLKSRIKLFGQVFTGLVVGSMLYFWPEFAEIGTQSTVPFFKNTNVDYALFGQELAWLIYIPVVIFIITAVSNAVNLTDGLDGLATGTSAISGIILGVFAYLSGRVDTTDYLDILYLPGAGELTIFAAALVGASIGFLWFNTHPASVFMGDTGSLAVGGALGALAIMVHKELLLPILCGVFFMETLSVIIQTTYFKWTKRLTGEGKRVFLMSPIHHHFEKLGWSEPKIVVRFWILAILMGLLSLLTLKLR